MARLDIVIPERFSDWECGLLAAVAGDFLGHDVRHLTPRGRPVQSMGGLLARPDDIATPTTTRNAHAVAFCGGAGWTEDDEQAMARVAHGVRARGALLAAICAGTRVLARAGALDDVHHTSNDLATLSVAGYAGADRYVSVAHAVTDDGIVTASGTSPISFTQGVLNAIGPADTRLDAFLGRFSAEHQR